MSSKPKFTTSAPPPPPALGPAAASSAKGRSARSLASEAHTAAVAPRLIPSGDFQYGAKLQPGQKDTGGIEAQRMHDKKVQQLRGIFAGFDVNADNVLVEEELSNACIALGAKPTDDLLAKYFDTARAVDGPEQVGLADVRAMARALARAAAGVWTLAAHQHSTAPSPSHPQFIDVSLRALGSAPTIADEVEAVLKEFANPDTGRISVPALSHLLSKVHTGSELSMDELDDFLNMIGIAQVMAAAKARHATHPAGTKEPQASDFEINTAALVEDMLFVEPKASK